MKNKINIDIDEIRNDVSHKFKWYLQSEEAFVQPYTRIFEIKFEKIITSILRKIDDFFNTQTDDSIMFISDKSFFSDIALVYDMTHGSHVETHVLGSVSKYQWKFDLRDYNLVVTEENKNRVLSKFVLIEVLKELGNFDKLYHVIFREEISNILSNS